MCNSNQRIHFVDYFKALLMILVVVGHVNFANESVKAWIYSFHMPAFFFATGLLLNTSTDFKNLLAKYSDKLLFPYFLWGLVFAKFTIQNLFYILYGSYRSIGKAGALTSLWFLPVMFFAILFFFCLKNVFKKKFNIWIKLACSLFVFSIGFIFPKMPLGYPWSINVAFVALGFMLIGSALGPIVFGAHSFFGKQKWLWMLLLPFLIFACVVASLMYSYNIPEKGYVLMGNARYGNPFFFVFTSIFGTLLILFFSMLIDFVLKKRDLKIMSFIGQNTLCIFAVQKPIIHMFGCMANFVQMPNYFMLFLTLIGTLIISSLACLFFNKYLPIFVGKQLLFANSIKK